MTTLPTPPTPRLKTHWFRHGGSRGAAQQASAAAFIVWRIARHTLDRTRHAGFAVEVGPPYFRFLREVLAFLVAIADRIAYARLEPQARCEFVVALVRHLARILQDSEDDLIGAAPPDEPSNAERFVDLVNGVSAHYAEFGADPTVANPVAGFAPDFAFLRYLGTRLAPALPDADRRWILDQVIDVQAPEAVAMLQRSLQDLFDPPVRRARAAGLSGD